MALDERLAEQALPTVRLFLWDPPAVSLGRTQHAPEWLRDPRWRASGLEAVERPTGGGIAFHRSDLSISIVVPRTAGCRVATIMRAACEGTVQLCATYGIEAVSLLEAQAIGRIIYCSTQPSPYAVCVGGRKVAGFAIRRYPESWLIQGSLVARPFPAVLLQAIPRDVADALHQHAVALSALAGRSLSEPEAAQRWVQHWPSWWEAALREDVEVAV